MKISIKNIGIIKDTTIEINGITVIAGDNNTGKSTIGKSLFSIFNSAYNVDEQIEKERKNSVEGVIYRNFDIDDESYLDFESFDSLTKEIWDKRESIINNKEVFIKIVNKYINNYNNSLTTIEDHIVEILKIPKQELLEKLFFRKFNKEFDGQISNKFNKDRSEIILNIKNQKLSVIFDDDKIKVDIPEDFSLKTEVIYIDDPFVLDRRRERFINGISIIDHQTHLYNKVFKKDANNFVDEIYANNKLKKIYELLNAVCAGEIVYDERERIPSYGMKNVNTKLSLRNLSTGLKSFVILKTLLSNGTINNNGTIIFDEPEVHLHPEWQLIFAELLVLIQKEFNLHMLINTHSPYFLEAIEIYSKKYLINNNCNYYSSNLLEDGSAEIIDVTNNIDIIYRKMAMPLQILNNEKTL